MRGQLHPMPKPSNLQAKTARPGEHGSSFTFSSNALTGAACDGVLELRGTCALAPRLTGLTALMVQGARVWR